MKTNSVQLIGYVGNHIKSGKSNTGNTRAGISVATHFSYRAKDGEIQYRTVWHDVVAWCKLGDYALRTFVKGSRIMVEGHLNPHEFTVNGERFFKTYITATSITNLDR